jgi:transcription initiation factor TFIID subunit 7
MADGSDGEDVSEEDDASGDDEDEEGIRSGDEEEDEELAEKKAKIKQYTSEIKILETTIEKKKNGFTGGNPIMVKRFEETIGGLQADINTKVSARQSLMAEVATLVAAKAPEPIPVEAITTPRKAGSRIGSLHEDEDDGEDAESYEDSPARPVEHSDPADEDDLFGDGEDDEYEEVVETPSELPVDVDSQHLDDEEADIPEIDDEMAALLEAELGNEINAEIAEATISRALEDMEVDIPIEDSEVDIGMDTADVAFQSDSGFGVEGGVGMRRLATGALDEGEGDSDSEESD